MALKYLRKSRDVVSFNGIARYWAFNSRRLYTSGKMTYFSSLMVLPP